MHNKRWSSTGWQPEPLGSCPDNSIFLMARANSFSGSGLRDDLRWREPSGDFEALLDLEALLLRCLVGLITSKIGDNAAGRTSDVEAGLFDRAES